MLGQDRYWENLTHQMQCLVILTPQTPENSLSL